MGSRVQLTTIHVLAVAVALTASMAMADTKVVQSTHTGGIMGQPASDSTNTVWLADDRMRMDSEDGTMIVRLDQKKIYVVDHKERSYSAIQYPVDLASMLPPEMAQMMSAMKFEVTVTPSDETKTLLGHQTRRFDVTMKSSMMEMKQTIWAAKDVNFDYAAARDMINAIQSLQPGMTDAFKELSKIEGFQLAMQGSMGIMGKSVDMSSKTVSIDEGGAPEGGYDPPAGYAEKPFNPMQR